MRALVDILVHLYDPGELEFDVLPAIVHLPPDAPPPSALDTLVASGLSRHLERLDAWAELSPRELGDRLPMLEALRRSQRENFGEHHAETLLTGQIIAYALATTGSPSAALRLFRGVLRGQEETCGVDSVDTVMTRLNIAALNAATDPTVAIQAMQGAVADMERLVGSDDLRTLFSRYNLAYLVGASGDTRAAFIDTQDVLRRAEAALGPDHRLVRAARQLLASLTVDSTDRSAEPLPRELREAFEARTDDRSWPRENRRWDPISRRA